MRNLNVDKILDEAPDEAEFYYGGLYYKIVEGKPYFWLVHNEWVESYANVAELAYSLVELKKQHNSILL